MLGRRTTLDVSKVKKDDSNIRRQLAYERNLREEIAKLANQLADSRKELNVYPGSVKAVVDIGLELAEKPPLEEAELNGVWPDPYRTECPVFKIPLLDGPWRHCTRGLLHPHTEKLRPITFDDKIAEGRDDVVLVHLNHRLVQMCQRLLRKEVWSASDAKMLSRVTARMVPQKLTTEPVVIAYGRIVVLGADNQSLHEEIIFSGGTIGGGKFKRIEGVGKLQELIESVLTEKAPSAIGKQLKKDWPKIGDSLMKSLQTRMNTRTKNLESFLEKRAAKEVKDVETILGELETSIRSQFKQPEEIQEKFWKEFPEEEFDRNQDNLKLRLAQIPVELEKEKERITRHYSEPTPRLFPVAVMLLVPKP